MKRIVCLSAEAAEICAGLDAWDDLVAVSAYADQRQRTPKPVVGGFSKADLPGILALRPELVITFSDVQADFAAELIRAGCTVLATNQRSLSQISQTIRLIGGAIGRPQAAAHLAFSFEAELAQIRTSGQRAPRVYFEEWPDPLVCGIGWVSEIIELAGGRDIFASRRGPAARDRAVTAQEVIALDPEIILASWCGKRVDFERLRSRPGFAQISAVRTGQLFALDSSDLLQPGPRLVQGAREVARILAAWRSCNFPGQHAL